MLSCDQYDYIEIVCMYKYPIKLTLKSNETVAGKALDTQYNDKREECIKLIADNNTCLIVLNTIKQLHVCVDNPHFQTVEF